MEATIEVGVLLRRMVVVVAGGILVAVERVEAGHRRAVRLGVAVDGIAIERPGDRLPLANLRLEMDWGEMIVVVVGPAAVAAVVVELADRGGIFAPIVERIEDRDPIDRQRDRPAEEAVLSARRLLGRHRLERNLPGVVADVGLGERHLLLPGADPDHQWMVGDTLPLNEEEAGVAVRLDRFELHKRREGLGDADVGEPLAGTRRRYQPDRPPRRGCGPPPSSEWRCLVPMAPGVGQHARPGKDHHEHRQEPMKRAVHQLFLALFLIVPCFFPPCVIPSCLRPPRGFSGGGGAAGSNAGLSVGIWASTLTR